MALKKIPRSPLAPQSFATLAPINGLGLHVYATGSRYRQRDDLLVVTLPEKTKIAGVFTKSSMPSAAVDLCKAHLKESKGRARAIIVNAGIANAFTGKQGQASAETVSAACASLLGIDACNVYMASTGVIGQDLDPSPLVSAMLTGFDERENIQNWMSAAQAICTTDTFPKVATGTAKFGKHRVHINVIAKGSGMIAPDMATMLAFGFTDAALPAGLLQKLIRDVNGESFNSVTVDGDTSTSDTFLFCATGEKALGGAPLRSVNDPRLGNFKKELKRVVQDVAIQIACDGEGATKLMTIDIKGAQNDIAARKIALAIGNSPLVKTAIAGEDANWGRIVMAIGKSGERADRDKLGIKIGGHLVARKGRAIEGYDETLVAEHMQTPHISIEADVGVGKGRARVWACDLTHGYISINADYRS